MWAAFADRPRNIHKGDQLCPTTTGRGDIFQANAASGTTACSEGEEGTSQRQRVDTHLTDPALRRVAFLVVPTMTPL